MDNLLYYPYINLPESNWAARALLYYDSVGTIVPREYLHSSQNPYEPFMREVIVNGLVRAVNPMEVLNNPYGLYEEFMRYVTSEDFELDKRKRSFLILSKAQGRNRDKIVAYNGYPMHVEKFEHSLYEELRELGLAEKINNRWYNIERKTANDLMTFLASVIGKNINYQPTTNEIANELKGLLKRDNIVTIYDKEEQKRDIVLSELMPFPELIELDKLRAFKDKHYDSLRAFRRKVEDIALDPALDPNTPLFNNRVEELKIQKEALIARMNESKLGKIVFGTFCGTLAGGITVATAGTIAGAALAAPAFIHAIYNACQIERPENIIDQTGLKFAALVDKRIRKPAYYNTIKK